MNAGRNTQIIAGMTNSAQNAEMPSQMAMSRPISAWKRSDDTLHRTTLTISVDAVINTPRPALFSYLMRARARLSPPACNASRTPSTT